MNWLWIILILILIVLVLWWLGRQEQRGEAKREIKPAPEEKEAGGLPELAAPPAPPLEEHVGMVAEPRDAELVPGADGRESSVGMAAPAPVVEEPSAPAVVEVPPAGSTPGPDITVVSTESSPAVVEAASAEVPVAEVKKLEREEAAMAAQTPPVEPAERPAAPVEVPVEPAAPVAPDDLEIVEGIGPKIAGLLKTNGIVTFRQLASTDVAFLHKLMLEANLRIADPTTWPEQAGLAAEGKWDELKTLQDSLKGGRKVGG